VPFLITVVMVYLRLAWCLSGGNYRQTCPPVFEMRGSIVAPAT
jgi:uncharacterized protein YaaW (UPF0174 family)